MIAFDLSALPSALCAAVLLRIGYLSFVAARAPEPTRSAFLQRIRAGGERGFLGLTTVLVLAVFGGSRRNAWMDTFFTGDLGVQHVLGAMFGLLMVLSRLHQLEPHSRPALVLLGKELPVLLIGGGLLASIDYSEPVEKFLYGVRVISYPVLLLLLILQRQGRRVSEDVPSVEVEMQRPLVVLAPQAHYAVRQNTVTYETNIHVVNHYHVTQQIVRPAESLPTVEVEPASNPQRTLLPESKRKEISRTSAKELAGGVGRKLLGRPARSDKGGHPS